MDSWQRELNHQKFSAKTQTANLSWSMLAPSAFNVYEEWQRTLQQLPAIRESKNTESITQYYKEMVRLTLLMYYTRMRAVDLNTELPQAEKEKELTALSTACGATIEEIGYWLEYA